VSLPAFPGRFRHGKFGDAEIAEAEIGRRIVSLNAEMSGGSAQALAGIVVGLACVDPVGDGIAVHPDGKLWAASCDGHREPFEVRGNDFSGGDAAIDSSGSEIDRLTAVVTVPLIANLRFVAVGGILFCACDGTEEDAGIEVLSVGEDFRLQDEISVLIIGFEIPATVFDMKFAFIDVERAFSTGDEMPAGQVVSLQQ